MAPHPGMKVKAGFPCRVLECDNMYLEYLMAAAKIVEVGRVVKSAEQLSILQPLRGVVIVRVGCLKSGEQVHQVM